MKKAKYMVMVLLLAVTLHSCGVYYGRGGGHYSRGNHYGGGHGGGGHYGGGRR